ncbi:MAG: hypothetical protein HOV94_39875 [Saccharothrix sp.]|nr:hypothetical protein [Saccharothrix sp.]
MPVVDGHPVVMAVDIARNLQAKMGSSVSSIPKVMGLVRRFAAVEFEVPNDVDGDGYLFQLGIVNWLPELAFVLSVVRQLEVVDQSGEHENYIQVRFGFTYPLDEELKVVGSHAQWWFPGAGVTFDSWVDAIEESPIVTMLAKKDSWDFQIQQDLV